MLRSVTYAKHTKTPPYHRRSIQLKMSGKARAPTHFAALVMPPQFFISASMISFFMPCIHKAEWISGLILAPVSDTLLKRTPLAGQVDRQQRRTLRYCDNRHSAQSLLHTHPAHLSLVSFCTSHPDSYFICLGPKLATSFSWLKAIPSSTGFPLHQQAMQSVRRMYDSHRDLSAFPAQQRNLLQTVSRQSTPRSLFALEQNVLL